MVYIQKVTPPPNQILTFSLKNFNGGLNNRSDQLQVNEASDLLNMSFADDTVLEKRKGVTHYNTWRLPSTITFMDEFKPYDDTNKLLYATNTELYVDGVKLGNISGSIQGTNYQGKYVFTDGVKMYMYGKFPQADELPYSDVIGTPVNNYVLMEVANPPEGFTPLDKKEDGTAHLEGVKKYDYTNKKVWYEPCKLEVEDTSKGSNVLPEKPKYVVVHDGRLYVSGSDKDNDNVFISDVQNPYYFGVYLPMQLPPNSDEVQGLVVYDDAVVVGRKHDIFAIHGETNNPDLGMELFKLRRLNTHTGFASQDTAKVAHNFLFFIGSDGNAYSLSSSQLSDKILGTQIISKSIDLFKTPINVSKNDLRTAKSVFHDDEWYISIQDKVLVYSYRHRAWVMYNGLYATSFYVLNDELIWGCSKDNSIAKFGNDYFDFGKPFKAYWVSKYFDMDEANYFKQFREFFIVAHTYRTHKSDIVVTFQIDYDDVNENYEIQSDIAVWGRARWGNRFINRDIVASLPFIIGRRGRSIRIRVSNGYFEDGEVTNVSDLEYVPEKYENMLIKVTSTNTYYLYRNFEWMELSTADLNQRMKIYQINGDYELRGKR